jgi:5'-nucleotidase
VQKVFQGGSVSDLHNILGISDAAGVLYVGDHIYGDILRSKKSMGWRTMLIVPELEMELKHAARCRAAQDELETLRGVRDAHDERIHRLRWTLEHLCVL